MKELEIIIRPEKLEKLKSILDEFHCGGMTISSVMGCGTQRGNTEGETKVIKGLKTNINLLPKILVDVVTDDDKVEGLVDKISREISTGSAGDGKTSSAASRKWFASGQESGAARRFEARQGAS